MRNEDNYNLRADAGRLVAKKFERVSTSENSSLRDFAWETG